MKKETNKQKDWVRERYGAIAKAKQPSCCGGPGGMAKKAGYTAAQRRAAPQAAQTSLGCGNPLALASIKAGETVLDLGSGAGFDALLAAARAGKRGRVIGVDMTPQMIRKARANAKRAGFSNVEFRLGDIEALPVDAQSVDLVISNCVLNLVPDKRKAFREIARVLKPGGRAAVADIVLDRPLPKALRDNEDIYTSCVGGAISRARYLRLLEQAGLSEVRVVSETDAADLLSGACCGDDLPDVKGIATSIHVTARKPAAG